MNRTIIPKCFAKLSRIDRPILRLFVSPSIIDTPVKIVRTTVVYPFSTVGSSSTDNSSTSTTKYRYSPDINQRSSIPNSVKNNPRLASLFYATEFAHSSSSEEIIAMERSDMDPYTLETSSVNTDNKEDKLSGGSSRSTGVNDSDSDTTVDKKDEVVLDDGERRKPV